MRVTFSLNVFRPLPLFEVDAHVPPPGYGGRGAREAPFQAPDEVVGEPSAASIARCYARGVKMEFTGRLPGTPPVLLKT